MNPLLLPVAAGARAYVPRALSFAAGYGDDLVRLGSRGVRYMKGIADDFISAAPMQKATMLLNGAATGLSAYQLYDYFMNSSNLDEVTKSRLTYLANSKGFEEAISDFFESVGIDQGAFAEGGQVPIGLVMSYIIAKQGSHSHDFNSKMLVLSAFGPILSLLEEAQKVLSELLADPEVIDTLERCGVLYGRERFVINMACAHIREQGISTREVAKTLLGSVSDAPMGQLLDLFLQTGKIPEWSEIEALAVTGDFQGLVIETKGGKKIYDMSGFARYVAYTFSTFSDELTNDFARYCVAVYHEHAIGERYDQIFTWFPGKAGHRVTSNSAALKESLLIQLKNSSPRVARTKAALQQLSFTMQSHQDKGPNMIAGLTEGFAAKYQKSNDPATWAFSPLLSSDVDPNAGSAVPGSVRTAVENDGKEGG